jgi:transposase
MLKYRFNRYFCHSSEGGIPALRRRQGYAETSRGNDKKEFKIFVIKVLSL